MSHGAYRLWYSTVYMKPTHTIITIVTLAIIGIFIWFYESHILSPQSLQTGGATVIYKDTNYGFEVAYPKSITPTNVFANSYTLQNQWRIEASSNNTGIPVVVIPVFHVDHGGVATGQAYPLFFDAEVRIGVSNDPADVADCLKPDPNFTNQPEVDAVVNGISFKKFSVQDAATMKYIQAESYRTVHNGYCFAVEQVKTGSSYRDPSMTEGISDAILNGYYDEAGEIIKTFKFTK